MIKDYKISRINLPDITFKGGKLGHVSSGTSLKATRTGRWTELSLYLTVSQKYILVITGMSNRDGEVPLNTVYILDHKEDIVDKLGFTHLAKRLYKVVKLEVVEEI